jgi:hypothetical protein
VNAQETFVVIDWRDSDTYLAILEEGAVKALQEILLELGDQRFGQPDEATQTTLTGIADLGRLRRMSQRLLGVNSWQELLATP